MSLQTEKQKKIYRAVEIIYPAITWLIITLPLWLSPFRPALASYFILAYFVYFLFKTVKTIYYAIVSYRLMETASKINWKEKLKTIKGWRDIEHYIVIVNYKETAGKVSKTIDRMVKQSYNLSRVTLVLAMEEREKEALPRSNLLSKKYKRYFKDFITTYHILKDGEVAGKASNEAYAGKVLLKKIEGEGRDIKKTIITICDADSLLPKDYLSYVTHAFLKDDYRLYRFYWAPVLLYTNFWNLKLPVRVQAILSSITRFSYLSWGDDLIQISTYSTNMWLLKKVDFWDVDIIPEDWHIWFQAFFKFGNKVRTIPIYLPIVRDAIYAQSRFGAYKSRYEQEKRWAWGVSDVPYAIARSFDTPHISWYTKFRRLFYVSVNHMLWPTSFFILTISASIPPLVNPAFKRTVLGFLLPQLSSLILTATTISLLIIIYFDYKIRKKIRIQTKWKNIPMLFIQWYLLPVISLFFSSLPALEAHTRLMMGKGIKYKVTKKKS